jgi:HlyD family type I secretion membrane fusion protein
MNKHDADAEAPLYFRSDKMVRAHRVLYAMIGFTLLLVALAFFLRIDIVARGIGQLSPDGYNTLMRSPREGLVQQVFAANGAAVKAGARLVSFDCTVEQQIVQSIAAQIALARQALANQIAVADAILPAAQLAEIRQRYGKHAAPPAPGAQGEAATRVGIVRREIDKIAVAQKQWSAQQAGLVAKLESARNAAKLSNTQLERQRDLRSRGFIADAALDEAKNNALKAGALETAAARELEVLRADTNFTTSPEVLKGFSMNDQIYRAIASAAVALTDLETQFARAAGGVRNCELTAPVDGQLFWVSDIRPGGWVKASDSLFKIVPKDRKFIVEARFRDADIAYVRTGQKAYVKVDGLPYIKYGTLPAVIQFVSPDTVSDGQAGALYRVTLMVEGPDAWALEKGVELKAGLGIKVEVVTGSRRLYEYFFEPLVVALRTSFQER